MIEQGGRVLPWFYASAPLVIVGWWAAAAGLFIQRKHRRWVAACAAGAFVAAGYWMHASWRWREPTPVRAPIRVLFWNVARGALGWEAAADRIPFNQFDLIGLAEAGPKHGSARPFWGDRAKGLTTLLFPREMALLVRGPAQILDAHGCPSGLRVVSARVQIRRRAFLVILIDAPSTLRGDRARVVQDLLAFLRRQPAALPRILMGDFNLPKDSPLLAPLRKEFRDAFETAGRGLNDTWPAFLPCLSLDQVWVSKGLPIAWCRHVSTLVSDHRQVRLAIDGATP